MSILISIFVIIISFALIIWGGDKFVDCSISLAKKAKIPTAVIGATVTSIGTTLPELLVTIFSSSSDASGLAVGNALGSAIFNTCIIGGLLLIFLKLSTKHQIKTTLILYLFSCLMVSVMCINGVLSTLECILLIAIFLVFVIINFKNSKNINQSENKDDNNTSLKIIILMFVISALAIGTGAYFSVKSATDLAKAIGLSDTLIGLTIVCAGTSLPELITTITAIRKKEFGLGIGNIVGSNIINCSLLLGITGIMNGGISVSKQTLFIAIPFTLLSAITLSLSLIFKIKSTKWQGFLLFSIYILYYFLLVTSTIMQNF